MCSALRGRNIMQSGEGPDEPDLEDYIVEMEVRADERAAASDDIFTQLAQKEKDLILAAQLGKALLEKNEDLSRQNEKIAEEFSQKLELLEQDKYILRRKLDRTCGEYDMRVADLQGDLESTKGEMEEQTEQLREVEKQKNATISELTEQNTRLTNQLKDISKKEETLNSQLWVLRDQFNARRSHLTDHEQQLELLRQEIILMTDKKLDLERRLDVVSNEREDLNTSLDNSSDRIALLEKKSREQEYCLVSSHREVDELRSTNTALVDRLNYFSRMSLSPPGTINASLHNEMESTDSSGIGSQPGSGWTDDGFNISDDDIELDGLHCLDTTFNTGESKDDEVLDVYRQVRGLIDHLKDRRNSSPTTLDNIDDVTINQIKVGMLRKIMKELKNMVHDLINHEVTISSSGIEQLEAAAHHAKEKAEAVTRTLTTKEEELKRAKDEINLLKGQMDVSALRVSALEEERDTLRDDLSNTSLSKEELIKKAWETRDSAVARKNAAEIELARTRIDVMQVNSQLMESVQQKIELSQQLEQWQVDMHMLLDEQMRSKLTKSEPRRKSAALSPAAPMDQSTTTTSRRVSKILSLIKR